jgi:YVTN family beta-propeller protein
MSGTATGLTFYNSSEYAEASLEDEEQGDQAEEEIDAPKTTKLDTDKDGTSDDQDADDDNDGVHDRDDTDDDNDNVPDEVDNDDDNDKVPDDQDTDDDNDNLPDDQDADDDNDTIPDEDEDNIPAPTPVPTSNGDSNNASQPGTLLVTKQVINEGGGEAEPSDFAITVDGNTPNPSSFDGSSSGISVQLFEGRYNVTESGPDSNYTSALSKECSGNMREGESKRCTITNTYSEPSPPVTTANIIVTKKVINDGGGDKRPSDFAITVDGNTPNPSSFDGSSSGTTITINEGSYNVTEEGGPDISYDYVPGKYTPSYSSNCAGNIRTGDTVRCTITNKYNQFIPGILPKLIVTKQVINEGGGEAEPSDFTITVDGNTPNPSSFDGRSSGTSVTLEPGSYSVSENSLPEYTSSKSGDCAGSLSAGETKQCTITNIYKPIDKSAQLIVINNVIDNNNDDGSELTVKPSAFIITVQGNDPLPRSFPGKSGKGVIVNLNPGRYSVTTDGPDGYTSDYSEGCQGTIRTGDAKACIITNEEITPPSPIPPQPPQPTIETITGFSTPYGITLNPDNGLFYVSNYGQLNTTGSVSVLNGTTNAIVANIPVGKNPQAIIYNPANGLVYTANTLSNTLSIINSTSNSLVGSIIVGAYPGMNPSGITINPINNTIYVTNMGSNTVSVINGTTNVVINNITLVTGEQEQEGAGRNGFFSPAGIAYDSDNGNLYVTNRGSDSLSVINGTTNTLVNEMSLDAIAPSGVVYNAANNYIYVTNMGSNTVSVINGTTNAIVTTIPVGLGPNAIAYNQDNGDVYVANSINGTITIVDGLRNTVSSTIQLGINYNNPNDISYDASNDTLFITNTNSSTVSVIKNQ